MLVVYCCDDIVVLIQSLISRVGLHFLLIFSPLFPGVCVCVVAQGGDAIRVARVNGYNALADEVEVRPTAVPVMSLQ